MKDLFCCRMIAFAAILSLCGCVSVPQTLPFEGVSQVVKERSGLKVSWHVNGSNHPDVKKRVEKLLEKPLTSTTAVEISLLNNPNLQAAYAQLGIAQADLIQAGLIENPSFGTLFRFPQGAGSVSLDFDLVFNFLNIFTRSLRESIAASRFEEVQLKMIKLTLDLAARTREAYFQAQAARQKEDLFKRSLTYEEAAFTTQKELRKAGNISELNFSKERASYEQDKIDSIEVKARTHEEISKLTLLMGLCEHSRKVIFSKDTFKESHQEVDLNNIEGRALCASIDLAMIKQRLETLAREHKITNIKALVPDFKAGGLAEREEHEWKFGPSFEFTVPVFDQGQAAKSRISYQVRALQEEYRHKTLQIRSRAQMLKHKFFNVKKRIYAFEKNLLPAHQSVADETLFHYNAMQVSVFDLLNAKKQQIQAEQNYLQALLEVCLVRTQIQQLLHGSLPPESGALESVSQSNQKMDPEEGQHP